MALLKLNKKYYKFIDYLLVFLPIIIILGSPFINFTLATCSLLFLYLSFKNKFWKWLKNTWIRLILVFWLYSIFLSFLSPDLENSLRASFFFIRFVLFALFIQHLAFNYFSYLKVFKAWGFIIIFVCFDIWVQYFFGKDLFGYQDHGHRFAGLFGNELVAGAFLWKISAPFVGLLFYEMVYEKKKNIIYSIITLLLLIITILITGERASFLMFIFALTLSTLSIFYFQKKIKLFIFFIFISLFLFFSSIILSDNVKNRYNDLVNIIYNFEGSSYGVLFKSGLEVWKEEKILGVGLKSYSKVCDTLSFENNTIHQSCSTHPHNLYIQILSETGLIGMILFLSFLISFFLSYSKRFLKLNEFNKNKFLLTCCTLYLFTMIWPLTTSGSFYSTWNGFYYWIIIGIILNLTKKNKLSFI